MKELLSDRNKSKNPFATTAALAENWIVTSIRPSLSRRSDLPPQTEYLYNFPSRSLNTSCFICIKHKRSRRAEWAQYSSVIVPQYKDCAGNFFRLTAIQFRYFIQWERFKKAYL